MHVLYARTHDVCLIVYTCTNGFPDATTAAMEMPACVRLSPVQADDVSTVMVAPSVDGVASWTPTVVRTVSPSRTSLHSKPGVSSPSLGSNAAHSTSVHAPRHHHSEGRSGALLPSPLHQPIGMERLAVTVPRLSAGTAASLMTRVIVAACLCLLHRLHGIVNLWRCPQSTAGHAQSGA